MKKFNLIFILLVAIGFAACEPNESIYEELDKQQDAQNEIYAYNVGKELAPGAYTLTDEDYALSSNDDVKNYMNFSSSALPKDFLPEILNKKFSAEDGFEMMVTYNYYEKPVPNEGAAYELTDADYDILGQSYGNFEDEDDAEAKIGNLLDLRSVNAEKGDEQTVMYILFSRGDDRYIRVNADGSTEEVDEDETAYELDADDYDALGTGYGQPGKYNNFDDIEDALDYMDDVAANLGDALPKVYKCEVYKNYYDIYAVFIYDGLNWMAKQSVTAVSEPLNFALNTEDVSQSTWWADPAIKITLGKADYDMFDETSRYQNFDLRGSVAPGTDRAKLVEMIGDMLDANHNPVDGQQYLVTYAYYDGSSGVAQIRVIRTAGVWSEHTL